VLARTGRERRRQADQRHEERAADRDDGEPDEQMARG
jgi:hypothetical protein